MNIGKRTKIGRCNTCGETRKLTQDHVPPKGCVRPTQMVLQHATARLKGDKPQKGEPFGNGVKFHTICERCNNALLGGRYDPVLIAFCQAVATYLESQLLLPTTIQISTKPQLLTRAIFGHIMALGQDRYDKGPRTEELRRFFLDDTMRMPEGLHFYYWLYPFKRQVLIRDHALLEMTTGQTGWAWIMKFYPVAFAIWQSGTKWTLPHRDLAMHRNASSDEVVQVLLDLAPVLPELILEAPTPTQAIMGGKASVVSHERAVRGRLLNVHRK